MSRARRRKPPAAAPSPEPAIDLGPAALHQHGEWRMPTGIRRVQRDPVYERLHREGRIDAGEAQACDDYARDTALAAGARDGGRSMEKVSGGTGPEPAEAIIAAQGRLRRAQARIGAPAAGLIDMAAVECASAREMARRAYGADHGGAVRAVEAALIAAIRLLARTPEAGKRKAAEAGGTRRKAAETRAAA